MCLLFTYFKLRFGSVGWNLERLIKRRRLPQRRRSQINATIIKRITNGVLPDVYTVRRYSTGCYPSNRTVGITDPSDLKLVSCRLKVTLEVTFHVTFCRVPDSSPKGSVTKGRTGRVLPPGTTKQLTIVVRSRLYLTVAINDIIVLVVRRPGTHPTRDHRRPGQGLTGIGLYLTTSVRERPRRRQDCRQGIWRGIKERTNLNQGSNRPDQGRTVTWPRLTIWRRIRGRKLTSIRRDSNPRQPRFGRGLRGSRPIHRGSKHPGRPFRRRTHPSRKPRSRVLKPSPPSGSRPGHRIRPGNFPSIPRLPSSKEQRPGRPGPSRAKRPRTGSRLYHPGRPRPERTTTPSELLGVFMVGRLTSTTVLKGTPTRRSINRRAPCGRRPKLLLVEELVEFFFFSVSKSLFIKIE